MEGVCEVDREERAFVSLSKQSLDSFGRADPIVQEAYVVYALSQISESNSIANPMWNVRKGKE